MKTALMKRMSSRNATRAFQNPGGLFDLLMPFLSMPRCALSAAPFSLGDEDERQATFFMTPLETSRTVPARRWESTEWVFGRLLVLSANTSDTKAILCLEGHDIPLPAGQEKFPWTLYGIVNLIDHSLT